MWNFKLRAGNLPLKLPECNLGNPPQNTTCNAPQNTKLQRKCYVDASSRSFLATLLKWRKPWRRTSKYESSVQSPLQTTIWQLARHLKLQNAPQITLPAALTTCSWNEDLGKKHWERGNPKNRVKGEKQQKTRINCEPILILGKPWFSTPKHTKLWSRNKREHRQNKIAIKKWTAHLDFWKTGFTATQQGRTEKKWYHSGATCNCSPKVQTTSCW